MTYYVLCHLLVTETLYTLCFYCYVYLKIFENLHTNFTIYFNILNQYLMIVIDLFQNFVSINLDDILCILDIYKLLKLNDLNVMYI